MGWSGPSLLTSGKRSNQQALTRSPLGRKDVTLIKCWGFVIKFHIKGGAYRGSPALTFNFWLPRNCNPGVGLALESLDKALSSRSEELFSSLSALTLRQWSLLPYSISWVFRHVFLLIQKLVQSPQDAVTKNLFSLCHLPQVTQLTSSVVLLLSWI